MDDAIPKTHKAKRNSGKKVKTGCYCCKQRRIKCDENRPECHNCTKAGRVCTGFPAIKRSTEIVPIAPAPIRSNGPTLIAAPPMSISSSSPSSSSSLSPRPTRRTFPARRIRRPISKLRQRPGYAPAPQSITFARQSSRRSDVSNSLSLSPSSFSDRDDDIIDPRENLYFRVGLGFNSEEGQYFQVFRSSTANELSGFFDSEFWSRSVLQQCHSDAPIRHAVVALGALYKTLEKTSESPPTSPDNRSMDDSAISHYQFALMQYGKAIRGLREVMSFDAKMSQRTLLISIVLFTCFQSFTGDHKDAIIQIQSGRQLLEDRRAENEILMAPEPKDDVEDELIQMFTRLAIQAKSYDMAFHFPAPYVIRLSPTRDAASPQSPSSPSDAASSVSQEPGIAEVFTTLQEAREALDVLEERIMRLQEALTSLEVGPHKIIPKSYRSYGQTFLAQLKQWGVAFEPIFAKRNKPETSQTERSGVNVLKMMHLMTYILFTMGFSHSESQFDNFYEEHKNIVELAKEVVMDEELAQAQARCGNKYSCHHRQRSQSSISSFPGPFGPMGEGTPHLKASFALDLGIVPPLFVVATKCRERTLRREAIGLLLSSPRREAMWDSILCGRAAIWLMGIEEEGLTPYSSQNANSLIEVVPEHKRVTIREILFDLQRRDATLRCGTRGKRDGDIDERERETQIFW